MTRLAAAVALCVALPFAALADDADPSYEKLARSPSAFSKDNPLYFTLRFQGLKDVEESFAAVGRNGTNFVQLVTPRVGGKNLPIFLSKGKSWWIDKLRRADTGVTYRFRGKMKYFKTDYYAKPTAGDMSKMGTAALSSLSLGKYYGSGSGYNSKQSKQAKQDRENAELKASGQVMHYLIDIYEYKEIPADKRPKEDSAQQSAGYESVEPGKLLEMLKGLASGGGAAKSDDDETSSDGSTSSSGSSKAVSLKLTYSAVVAALIAKATSGATGSNQWTKGLALPESIVKGGDLGDTAKQALKTIELPAPLNKVLAIAMGEDWDATKAFKALKRGDKFELAGTLNKSGGKHVLLLEGVKKTGSVKRPGPGPRKGPGPGGPGRGPGGR